MTEESGQVRTMMGDYETALNIVSEQRNKLIEEAQERERYIERWSVEHRAVLAERDALREENARLRERLEHIRCKSCGGSPADPTWQWAYGAAYANGHVYGGPLPDLCGPVEFVALEPTQEANRD